VFSQMCSVCHSANRNGPTLIGPPLFGVVGRPAAGVRGYAYSPAMKAAGFAWSDAQLHTYLQGPAKMLPGVRMPFAGVKNPTQLDDLIAYLDSLK
jgi:cytochrome c